MSLHSLTVIGECPVSGYSAQLASLLKKIVLPFNARRPLPSSPKSLTPKLTKHSSVLCVSSNEAVSSYKFPSPSSHSLISSFSSSPVNLYVLILYVFISPNLYPAFSQS